MIALVKLSAIITITNNLMSISLFLGRGFFLMLLGLKTIKSGSFESAQSFTTKKYMKLHWGQKGGLYTPPRVLVEYSLHSTGNPCPANFTIPSL